MSVLTLIPATLIIILCQKFFVQKLLTEAYINKNGFVRYWDDEAMAPFLFNGSSLISYDDPESIRLKCEYLKTEGLKGIMYWDHGSDPSRALLGAMWTAMQEA